MSKYLWLIDAGHGGLDHFGNYVTAPAKMFDHGDFKIYEGVVNRNIADRLIELMEQHDIDYTSIHYPVEDTPLYRRVQLADKIHESDPRCIYLSIHSNAGGGKGIEVYTSKGQTKSDSIAQEFFNVFNEWGKFKMRKDTVDGDDDKEANFYVLRKTDCPALLVELLFFDNRDEALYLLSKEGVEALAQKLFDAILRVEECLII